jgi:hypothetical protein
MVRLRIPGCRSKFEPVLSDDWPTWHVHAPPLGPGQAHEWWFAKRGVELLIVHDSASGNHERNLFVYGPKLQRRWVVLAFADAIPEWAGQLPDLQVWQGQQWIQDPKTGIVVARRHDPVTLANEQWVLGPDGPERVPQRVRSSSLRPRAPMPLTTACKRGNCASHCFLFRGTPLAVATRFRLLWILTTCLAATRHAQPASRQVARSGPPTRPSRAADLAHCGCAD